MNTDNNERKEFLNLKDAANSPLVLENWYHADFPPFFEMDYHMHPQFEIMYCEIGSFDFIYKPNENEDSFVIPVNKNCFILVNTGFYHKIANLTPSTKIINLEFLNKTQTELKNGEPLTENKFTSFSLHRLASFCPQLSHLINLNKNFYIFLDKNNVSSTMKEIIARTSDKDSYEKFYYINLLIQKLFIDISHCTSLDISEKTGVVYVDTALLYINSHFTHKLSVAEIARHAKTSEVYLQRLFKRMYGKSVHDIIIEKRITMAKHLLTNSILSISEIAEQCGFCGREQMIYNFHKYENCSPSNYKRKNVQKNIRSFSSYGEITLYKD